MLVDEVTGGMDVGHQTVTVPDGRQIEFVTAGPPGAMPLVLHGETPAGRVLFPPTVEAAPQGSDGQ